MILVPLTQSVYRLQARTVPCCILTHIPMPECHVGVRLRKNRFVSELLQLVKTRSQPQRVRHRNVQLVVRQGGCGEEADSNMVLDAPLQHSVAAADTFDHKSRGIEKLQRSTFPGRDVEHRTEQTPAGGC